MVNEEDLFYQDKSLNGQSQCYGCKQKGVWNISWSSMMWIYKKDNHCYCDNCKKEIENRKEIKIIMKTLRIYAKEVKLEKAKFMSYSLKSGDTIYNLKGTKTCYGLPNERGYFKITFNELECSISHKGKYPTIWLSGKVDSVRDVDYEKEIEMKKRAEVENLTSGQLFD